MKPIVNEQRAENKNNKDGRFKSPTVSIGVDN